MNKELIEKYNTELPLFSMFNADKAVQEIDQILTYCREVKETLLQKQSFTWQNFIHPLEVAEELLSKAFTPLSHLNAVQNSTKLREIYQNCVEKISAYATETAQDERLYDAYQKILAEEGSLNSIQKKALKDAIKAFALSGVALPDSKRTAFKQAVIKLTKQQSDFENHVLDATNAWHYHTENKADLKGLSEEVVSAASEKAATAGKTGYLLGIDPPTYIAVMQQLDHRSLREKFYRAYYTRASDYADQREFDNHTIMKEILALRQKKAELLGFQNYAELSLQNKMAASVKTVEDFLDDLLQKSKKQALEEFKHLQGFAKESGLSAPLQAWDVAYFSEKLKKQRFDFTEDELRPYFPLNQVLKGLFNILEQIYGLSVTEEEDFDRYNPEVRLYAFYDTSGDLRGKILLDLFARENKRSGAWMDEARVRYKKQNGEIQLPVAYVNCNFMAPRKGQAALLTHNDVVTLFHELGHALHHILTRVDYISVSGINGVEWDAVELPSQFMENFCWNEEGLKQIARHVKTGKSLPQALFKSLVASRQFQSAMAMLRQLEFALFDITLHQQNAETVDIHAVLNDIRKKTALLDVPSYNRFENSFSHIFAGGYAAGYYSYKWAEVLSSDAFAMFEASGEILNRVAGGQFLAHILEKGGSEPASVLFEKMRGRKPDVTALLRHAGIIK